ncbi:hypothetical protein [Streptomyces europaeiscabiei]|uniref:hypothetical protein n=1 Tax=Streptomyces europaeiscabiei TaxID=146819 RepID=UPI0029AAB548|nr:hypothetical protein [Streptomyces europaeiscabiei]MDX3672748.1 hypothetical protein [Streptomyces europaeiscabiei]
MFNETVTHTDGSTSTGTATETHALRLLRKAVRRGYHVEATRTGGAIIERDVHDGSPVPKKHTVTLEPVQAIGTLTVTVRRDIAAVEARGAYLVTAAEPQFRTNVGRIAAGFASIPPAASQRLVDRGLVGVGQPYTATSNGFLPETRVPVRVSLVAQLAMLAQDHRTHTIAPAGYVRPADVGSSSAGRQTPGGGLLYSRASPAGCSCRQWSATADGRDDARRLAREHRQRAAAAFIAALA